MIGEIHHKSTCSDALTNLYLWHSAIQPLPTVQMDGILICGSLRTLSNLKIIHSLDWPLYLELYSTLTCKSCT